ncbi:hypothetical protein ACF0H5_003646 [Mactra antiquata]
MFLRGYIRLMVLFVVWGIVASEGEQCPVTKKDCTCNFSSDAEDGGESTAADASSKSEMLAAAAGAMSPLLIGGAGLGIWKLLKRGGGDDSDDMDRSSSSMSTARSQPPDYASRSGTALSMTEDPDDEPFGGNRNNRGGYGDMSLGNRNRGSQDPNAWMH